MAASQYVFTDWLTERGSPRLRVVQAYYKVRQ